MPIENVYVANPSRSLVSGLVQVALSLLPNRIKRALRWWLAYDFQARTFSNLNGRVLEIRRGLFQGVILGRESLTLPMILGNWEKVVHEFIQLQSPYQVVVDIGAADGVYPIGMLKNALCSRAIAYEALEQSRQRIVENARLNEVMVEVRGKLASSEADLLFDELPKASRRSLIIMDVEGFEFELMSSHFVKSAAERNIDLVVELHGDHNQNATLVALLEEFFHVELVTQDLGRLDPEIATDLSVANELDWMDCIMESRQMVQIWALCKPK